MDRDVIYSRVLEVAEQFGAGNTQEFRLLRSQLSESAPEEVLAGLLQVFERSDLLQSNYVKQELAGRLLEKLKPKAQLDLLSTLRAVLPAYDPSIEQLPEYLAFRNGRELVIEALKKLQEEFGPTRAGAGARTMRWWLKDESLPSGHEA